MQTRHMRKQIYHVKNWLLKQYYHKMSPQLKFCAQPTENNVNHLHFNKMATQSISAKDSPIVKVKQGELRGSVVPHFDGTQYYSFMGIPYAKPPVGELRFQAPQPLQSWSGILDATKHGEICPQMDLVTTKVVSGDENCLFLNIYTKSLSSTCKKPVMFFIHGGGFMSGSGNSDVLGPEYLLQHDVVLVTCNYRLEMFGFLCLDTPEVPGNAGMKDQVAALKWVQENIEQFGGDKDNVTIFGESAGGASVTYHLLSPMSRGLFHKAISQSGVCINDWAQGFYGKERAIRAAKHLGKEIQDSNELLKFFQSVPSKDLIKITFRTLTFDEKYRGLPIHFAPVVEKTFKGVEAFLNETPLNLLLENRGNDVPLMIGYNSGEGIMSMKTELKRLEYLNKNCHLKVPREIALRVTEELQRDFGRRIKQYYFNSQDITENDRQKLADLESDFHFIYGIHRFVHLLNQRSPLYMYKFDLVTDMNYMKSFMGATDLKGASHADDLLYLFSTNFSKDTFSEQENVRELVFKTTKLWTDFAKTGNPTPDNKLNVKWSPYSRAAKDYLNLSDRFVMDKFADKANVLFWNKLYKEAGLPHIEISHL